MKKIALILTAILLTGAMSGQIAYDKKLHIGAGAVVGVWGTFAGNSMNWTPEQSALFGMGSVAVAGVGKELWDVSYRLWGYNDKFDVKDIGATLIGGVIGVGLSYVGLKIYYRHKPQIFTASVSGRVTTGIRIYF
jgi:uncharacterized protein YfiM (DUF2279 family)